MATQTKVKNPYEVFLMLEAEDNNCADNCEPDEEQDRESYSDDQDQESYSTKKENQETAIVPEIVHTYKFFLKQGDEPIRAFKKALNDYNMDNYTNKMSPDRAREILSKYGIYVVDDSMKHQFEKKNKKSYSEETIDPLADPGSEEITNNIVPISQAHGNQQPIVYSRDNGNGGEESHSEEKREPSIEESFNLKTLIKRAMIRGFTEKQIKSMIKSIMEDGVNYGTDHGTELPKQRYLLTRVVDGRREERIFTGNKNDIPQGWRVIEKTNKWSQEVTDNENFHSGKGSLSGKASSIEKNVTKDGSSPGTGVKRVQFAINRAGKNGSNKGELEKAKKDLQKKEGRA